MIYYHARWVLPVASPPVRNGWIALDGGRIMALGHGPRPEGADHRHLASTVILPGLVNAHAHLELSYLRGRIAPARQFIHWIRSVVEARRGEPDPDATGILRGVDEAIAEAVSCGTAVVGDISNTLVTVNPLTRSALAAVVFYELIQFSAADPEGFVEQAARRLDAFSDGGRIRTSLAAHAPYSVAPLVFRAIRRKVDLNPLAPCSVHLSESADEDEFVRTGGGAWRTFLEDVGAWDPAWVAPGGSPVEYLDENGFLDARVLAVHGVQMTPQDLRRLAIRGTTLVTCPRSNRWTGAGDPPIESFYESGVRVAIGTDSLASAPDMNLFSELAAMRALAPGVPASQFLDSATRHGARALGFEKDYGTLEPGKLARVLAVSVPDDVNDVEEYLVSGISPEQVRWLEGYVSPDTLR